MTASHRRRITDPVYEVWVRRHGQLPSCVYRGLEPNEAAAELVDAAQLTEDAMLLQGGERLCCTVGCTLTVEECR